MNWENQEILIKETVLHQLNIDYPLKTAYQIVFIKHVLKELDASNTEEIHDLVYEHLTAKLKEAETPEFSYKHFLLDDSNRITIKESNCFIRDGTTGLKLWPAAMALADFILHNTEEFQGKSILEIGSGATGFVGLVLIKTCTPKKVLLSDCHDSVLETLIENVNLNLSDHTTEVMEKSLLVRQRLKFKEGPELAVLSLPWEDVDKHEDELMSSSRPDVLLAADVVYDDTIFDALIKCIKRLFEVSGPSLVFYLSQAIRIPETFKKFCNLLLQNSFEVQEEDLKHPKFINWDSKSQIKLLRITKSGW